jgi:GH15 family glucan-1,4-alpha-glucosidase
VAAERGKLLELMPRDLIFGNGRLLVNLDNHLNIRDIFYPYVGQLNHVAGHKCRLGVWTSDVGFSWISDEWQRALNYDGDSAASDCTVKLSRLGVTLHVRHGVPSDSNIFLQHITVSNHWRASRQIRIFLAFDLRIDESDIGDTAFFNPYAGAMIHFKRDRYILASGRVIGGKRIAQYACGIKEFGGAEGTWRDAEDGNLSGNAISQGSVDSVIGFEIDLAAEGHGVLESWLAVGASLEEVVKLHEDILESDIDTQLERINEESRQWIDHEPDGLMRLPERVVSLFRRSVQITKAHIDKRGAILAATDSDIMQTARAHYAYVWPRDGALVAHAMDRLKMGALTSPFFEFCANALEHSPLRIESKRGDAMAMMHKYCPDGNLGASWHPWTILPDGKEIPIQEDGTALVVWSACQHIAKLTDPMAQRDLFARLVMPGANFLCEHRDPVTHLPLPSWDLWEERRGVHLYTTSAIIGALDLASQLALTLNEKAPAKRYADVAAQMRDAVLDKFWDVDGNRFVRTLYPSESGELRKDMVIDSSMFGAFGFGAFPADHPKVTSTMEAIGRSLWVKVGIGGLARYENDYYFRVPEAGNTQEVPGNPWIICTLWLAEWMIATSKSRLELESSLDLLEWTTVCAMPTGVLPEQIHPITYQPLSVAPLTWSHAQLITTVLNYLEKWDKLK